MISANVRCFRYPNLRLMALFDDHRSLGVSLPLESLNFKTSWRARLSKIRRSSLPLRWLLSRVRVCRAHLVPVLRYRPCVDCVGNIAGPQFVLQRQAPDFPTATKVRFLLFFLVLLSDELSRRWWSAVSIVMHYISQFGKTTCSFSRGKGSLPCYTRDISLHF